MATLNRFKCAALAFCVCVLGAGCKPAEEREPRFEIRGDVALDRATGLAWQREDDGVLRDWQDAAVYCADLEMGGYADWRLPSLDELTSIVDRNNKQQPGLNTAAIDGAVFPNTRSTFYWTATAAPGDPAFVRSVYFYDGWVDNYAKFDIAYVRCVRSGL